MNDNQDGSAARGPARIVILAVAFWIATYSIMTLRGRLDPAGPSEWITPKRFLTITVGTALYVMVVRQLDKLDEVRLKVRVLAGLAWAAGSAALLFAARWALGELSIEPFDAPEDLRWLLVWSGYFVAWVSIYLVLMVYERPDQYAKTEPNSFGGGGGLEDDLWIKTNRQSLRVSIESVEWFEAEGNYIRVHAVDASGLIRGSLNKLGDRLDPNMFVRVHRAVICRRSSIRSLKRTSTGAMRATLESGVEVPVGRAQGRHMVEAIRSERM